MRLAIGPGPILTRHGLTVARAERASGLSPGSLSRILSGCRSGLWFETVRRLAHGTKIRLVVVAEALDRTLEYNEEGRQRVRAAELACLKAELEQ